MNVLDFHVGLGLSLFCIGVFGFLVRRSALISLMCLELMLNGVNLCLVAYSTNSPSLDGTSLFLFIILVAAAEAAVALALLVAIYRRTGNVFLDGLRKLRG
jgi:NADH-quinone oxidoreductase subunit K